MTDKKAKIAGLIGLSAIGYYFYSTKNKNVESHKIDGLNVNINPDRLIESGLNLLNTNPLVKKQIENGLKGLVKGYMNKKDLF